MLKTLCIFAVAKNVVKMIKKYIILLAITILCGNILYAQDKTIRKGNHIIEGDINAQQLVEKHIEFNERVQTIQGYRICIAKLSGTNSKNQAFATKSKFIADFPETAAYIIFDEPNFVVKVGDFRSRLDAYAFLQKMKGKYSGTIVPDNIYPTKLEVEELVPETDDDANE